MITLRPCSTSLTIIAAKLKRRRADWGVNLSGAESTTHLHSHPPSKSDMPAAAVPRLVHGIQRASPATDDQARCSSEMLLLALLQAYWGI